MIGFDIQAVQSRSHGERGIARFCLELALAIERRAPDHIDHYLVNPDRPIPATLEPLLRSRKVMRSDELPETPLELLHVGSPVELDIELHHLLVGRPERLVTNLYDLIPLVFRDHYLRDVNTATKYLSRLGIYSASDLVLSDSQSAVDDAVSLLGIAPERCRVIGAGASSLFRVPRGGVDEALHTLATALPQLRPRFVMVPSGIDWRKNIEGVIRAYAALPDPMRALHQLVIVCRASDDERRTLTTLAEQQGCADTFVMTGYVPDHVLVALNQAAELVVFPSKYEGFGLPVLEARQCGAPVICGDNSSLREVVPSPAARFVADDDDALHRLLLRALGEPEFLAELRGIEVPPFSWDRAAQLTIEAHRDLLARSQPRVLLADARPRIVYVTPLPPVESGVARYSHALVTELARLARVRVFSDQDLSLASIPQGASASPLRDLVPMVAAGDVDHVVVALGNNELHRPALEALLALPSSCSVHLHDTRLVNCYLDERWPDVVARQYPDRFSHHELAQMDGPWAEAVRSKSVLLLAEVGRAAGQLLVHSEHASLMVDLDIGVHAVDIGPHAVHGPVPIGAALPYPGGGPMVVSLGIVSTVKQSDKIARAASILHDRGSAIRVAFVGHGADVLGEVSPNVILTGLVDDDEYAAWVERADVAVQLRDASNGESSGAVADCLAAGTAVIVTDLGSFAELPSDVARRVPRDISADELADEIEALVGDSARRDAMRVAGREYADTNTFARAAERLLGAVMERRVPIGAGESA